MKEGELRQIIKKTLNEDFGGPTPQEKNRLMRSVSQLIKQIQMRNYFSDEELVEELSKIVNLRNTNVGGMGESIEEREEELDEIHGLGQGLKHGNKLGELPGEVGYRDND